MLHFSTHGEMQPCSMKSSRRFHNIYLVNVISKRGLRELTARHPSIEAEALTWYRFVAAAERSCFADVRTTQPTDLVV
jgi:hypothetical protein